MAKKDGFDDFNLDNLDLDWEGFDEPPRQKDTKRRPIMDTLKTIRKSALAAIWPEGKRAQVILKGMPKAASEAYRGYEDAKSVTKDIYAHTKDEVAKTERVVKQQLRQLSPTLKRYLPERLTRKVDKYAKSDETDYGRYDPQQAGLDRMMAEVFNDNASMSAQEQKDAQQEANENKIRDSIRDMKSDALMNTVLGIARDVHLQTGLSRGIMLNIERKQLELQYRTLFALQDLSKLKQTEFDRNTPALEAIVKNTALPDYAKEDFSEVRWANVRRQAAEWLNPLRYADGFLEQIRENTKKKITAAFSEGRGILDMLLSGMQEDDFGLDDNASISPDARKRKGIDKGIGLATSAITKKLLGPMIEKLQGQSREWMENNPDVMSRLERARFKMRGITDGSFSNSAIAGEQDGAIAEMFRIANTLGIIQPLNREKIFLDERNGQTLGRSAKFDRKTWLTINEVIPAWFSEINKSIRRIYGEHADLEYDITTRGFTSRRDVADRVRKHVANDKGRIRMQESINEIVDYLDKDGKLPPAHRQKLADYLETRASLGRSMDVSAILKDTDQLTRYMSYEAADNVQKVLQARADEMTGGGDALSNEISNRISSVQAIIRKQQDTVDEAVNIYGERMLRDAGIFVYDKKKDEFGVDKDFHDPYTLYNDTRMGKTRTGRALTREQEIARKLANGSATADYLRRKMDNPEGSLDAEDKAAGPGKGYYGGSLTARQLARVLYGDNETNLVDLVGNRAASTGDVSGTERIVEAIRATSTINLMQELIGYVKSIDAKMDMRPHEDDDDEADGEESETRRPRRGRRRRREGGLFSRWFGVLGDTGAAAWRGTRRGVSAVANRGRRTASWLRGRFTGAGPGLLERTKQLIKGTASTAFNSTVAFGKGVLGIKDIYNEQGQVVLEGVKLERGEYWQRGEEGSEPRQLKTLDDIRLGFDIVDLANNVVLSATDLAAAGRLRYYKGGRLQSLFTALSGKAGGLINRGLKLPRKFGDFASGKLTTVKNWLMSEPDVYVKGETSPRLYSALMKQGKYLLKATGLPIFSAKDITGPVTDESGAELITQKEMENPEFALVDRWGRPIKSPLGRILGRVLGVGKRLKGFITSMPERARRGWNKLKDVATDNPLSRWWNKDKSTDESEGGWLSKFGSTSQKTNHILIRIYKLLNHRLAGEPEDESWTEEMEKGTSRSKTLNAVRKELFSAARKARVLGRRKFGRRFTNASQWVKGKALGAMGWLAGVRNRATAAVDSYREAEHDIGTRYDVEKRLLGRDDATAEMYRDRLYRRGKISKAKVYSAASDDFETAKDAAGNVIKASKDKAKGFGARLMEKINQMVDLQEVNWLNTMRTSLEDTGASDGFVRTLLGKFGNRKKFSSEGEKRDYFQWFRRRRRDKKDKGSARGEDGKKSGGMFDMLKSIPLLGPIVSILTTVGSILGTVAKWGIFKPAMLAGKVAWNVGKFALTRAAIPAATAVASAAGSVVAAVGWPAIAIVGGLAALGWMAYKLSTTTYTKYLDKMRLAQYGTRDYEEWSSEDGAKIRYLEKEIRAFITYNEGGEATCRGIGPRDVEHLAQGYGINPEDKGELLAFQAFMLQRFIPIYLRWLTALKGLSRDVSLQDVGDPKVVSKSDMLAIYSKTALSADAIEFKSLTDPRKVNRGFWSSVWDTVTFTPKEFLSGEEVVKIQERVKYTINWRLDDNKTKEFNDDVLTAKGIQESSVREAFSALQNLDNERQANAPRALGWETGNEQIEVQIDKFAPLDQKDVDALESIRFKTYGLKTLDAAYVNQLRALERFVLPNIDVKMATFKGKWEDAIDIIQPGVWKTPNADKMKLWFTGRFLPAFMFYVCGFNRYDPTGDPLKLKLTGGYLYELGLLVSRAYNLRGDIRQSVWEIAIHPFGEEANTDPSSVEKELETLKVLSKQADLAVRNMLKENETQGRRAKWKTQAKGTNFFETTDDEKNSMTFSADEQSQANAARGFGGGGFSGIPNDISQSVSAAGGVAEWAKFSTGNVGISLSATQDGDYKQLVQKYPIETLRNERNVKAMIVDVAKMMGVPPALALGMAQAESKFKYWVKNPYSSASGLYQFIDSTWDSMLDQYGQKYGIPGSLRARNDGQLDPWASAILGLQFIRNNIEQAQKDLGGKAPPPAVAYLYHFMGPNGGADFMQAWARNPNAPATSARSVTQKVMAANQSVFFENNGRGRMRTLDGVIRELNGRMGSVASNTISDDPSTTKNLLGGLTPAISSSSPAVNAGAAANDPTMDGSVAGAAQDLPANNEARKDEVLAAKGAQAADTALAGGTPGGMGAGNSSDVSTVADNIEAQAKADGMKDADVAKVKAAAEARTSAVTPPMKSAPKSDIGAAGAGLSTKPVSDEQLEVTKDIRNILVEIRDYVASGNGSLSSGRQSTTAQPGRQEYTQPTASLNVSRKAG